MTSDETPPGKPENDSPAKDPETTPIPVSRPVAAGRSRVIRPAGGRRPGRPGGSGGSGGHEDMPGDVRGPGDVGGSGDVRGSGDLRGGAGPGDVGGSGHGGVAPEGSPASSAESTGTQPGETTVPVPVTPRPSGRSDAGDETRETRDTHDENGGDPQTSPPAPPVTPTPRRLTRLQVQLLAALLLGALGFGLVVQARQTQDDNLSSLSQSELVRILDDVSRQSERLEAESRNLEATQNDLRGGTDRAAAAEKATRERLGVLGILAGTEPAQGPGINLTISDPQALVDAATLLDTVQELRDAGAEAIQFGSVRVVASTSFTDPATGGAVVADGMEQSPPYRLVAIGDPATMESALNIPGGVLETLHGVGASGTVQRRQDLTVSAVRQVSSPTYAVPHTDD